MKNIEEIRHSLAHILATAIKELYPKVKFGIGPAIENGFYYDFGDLKISDFDLPKIEQEMKKIIAKDVGFKKKNITKAEAKKLFKNQPYKLELLEDLSEVRPRINIRGRTSVIFIYQSGDFIDLCSGPHIDSTQEINADAFKLTRTAGAYWKGKEKNKMLTRIYGLAFESKEKLESFLKIQEEAEKRDHRKLGASLELFLLDEEIGQGLPIWLPKGAKIRKIIEDYLYQELSSQGYQWLYTPHIGNLNLWKKSGHWNFYKENLYSPINIDKEKYLLKPMNCPFHVKVYNSKIRSYKELPLKFAELGTVYRYERSGTLHGLTRVRGFTQDDAHLICTAEQMPKEVEKLVKQALKMLADFGFKDYTIYLSTRPEKYAGTEKEWEKATDTLQSALKELKLDYETDPGGGVFYGPKIDIKIKDSLTREWQCTTIQFDFNLPERFEMKYINEKGEQAEPYMIHRALLGSLERFFGVLIEHYAGAFPLWLSPVQILIIPIGSQHVKYAQFLAQKLNSLNLRTEIRDENETVSKKIRGGEIQKIPYILVAGDQEIKKKTVRVRERGKGDIGEMSLEKFIKNKLKRGPTSI
jgi:threonyl-tRNA synthetase